MPIQLNEENGGKILVIHVSGKLAKADYAHFVPDFHGWDAGAAWKDFKLGIKHFADIERLAMIGDKKWQHGMAIFCKPFTRATIRYFDQADATEARKWLGEA